MATIRYDCEVIIDGTGYFIKPNTYTIKHPRIREKRYRADGSLSYVDLGPGKRSWSMTILALNDLKRYDGTTVSTTGQQFRDALKTSYTGSVGTPLNFTDPLSGAAIPVHFDSYVERVNDLHTQIISVAAGGSAGASYEVDIELVEA